MHHLPEKTLPLLLSLDSESRYTEGSTEHPQRRITEWINGESNELRRHVARRRILLAELTKSPADAGQKKLDILGWALASVLAPSFGGTVQKPGNGDTFSFIHGVYPLADLRQIAELWPGVLAVLRRYSTSVLRPVLTNIESWCLPQRLNRTNAVVSDETRAFLQTCGAEMIRDLVTVHPRDRALRSWAAHTAKWAKLPLTIETDPDFELLLGPRDFDTSWQDEETKRSEGVRVLGSRLAVLPVKDASEYLKSLESEAKNLKTQGIGTARYGLYHELASRCGDPEAWIRTMICDRAHAHHVSPFIERLSKGDRGHASELLLELISADTEYSGYAVNVALTLDPIEPALFRAALSWLNAHPSDHILWQWHLPVSLPIRQRILREGSPHVRAHAAIREWHAAKDGPIPEVLRSDWREAVLNADNNNSYDLGQILESDSTLATGWLECQLQTGDWHRLFRLEDVVVNVCRILSREQRARLLPLFRRDNFHDDCFDALIGDDLTLYAEWFANCKDDGLRAQSLYGAPTARWTAKATSALDCGLTPEGLAEAAHDGGVGGMGPMSEHYRHLRDQYAKLMVQPDTRLHPIAQQGLKYTEAVIARELKEEHLDAVHGIGSRRRRFRG